ncbi:5-carboxymethyl-2-hydroxymuconate Delta-isomerase [Thalassovita gelatinovora]|uniref:5-carboxymethyl-2-hydroxymuconate Delta-isomerase n=1 Tax=Thalassovita gelatinovora TaxID=53501 RepID=A0A0P1FGZ1_THAGE|nr:5-carboxymethyl-2-hydroxymuconate Delta-isomerase [Thalassovita gelatinovora]QIZ81850.1 5-carboxymethyl-2-hydroxymuconate Delta-isomerase [Thalassovita gelatinovora]CUH67164.1 5-carboxymethyl-2-hydroxymuconate Delta-isomerase [Thalassovita gelatinovora]SEP79456.1 5-carboxymethyl-2-hydroxymuconate isomerase [Thalassovita gelatinovora]
MAHFAIDYSANLEQAVDWPVLCDLIRRAAIDTGVFPMAGVRVRAFRADHVSIADGNPEHGYIDISIRLRAGRTLEVRKRATTEIFAAIETYLNPLMATRSIALSLEMRDIDPDLAPKTGTIRDHLKG